MAPAWLPYLTASGSVSGYLRIVRSSRLLSILLLLQTRRRLTARELAAELEVSLRTV